MNLHFNFSISTSISKNREEEKEKKVGNSRKETRVITENEKKMYVSTVNCDFYTLSVFMHIADVY